MEKLADLGQRVALINGYATELPTTVTTLANSIKGVSPNLQSAFLLDLKSMTLTFSAGGRTQNSGGNISLGPDVITGTIDEMGFALYHEIGHAVWGVAREPKYSEIYKKLDPSSDPVALKRGDMEYFADAVAAQIQQLDGTAKEEVIAAAGALFKEVPEDEDHPVGTKRLRASNRAGTSTGPSMSWGVHHS